MSLIAVFALGAVIAQSASAEEVNFEEFKNCPNLTNELVQFCTQGHTTGGFYTVGPITVPITNSIVIQGGYYEVEEGSNCCLHFVAPENGQPVIVPTPEVVPGEPLANVSKTEMTEFAWPKALIKSYKKALHKKLFKEGNTTEVIEAAGLPHLNLLNFVFESGTAIQAPIKIVGKNPWLEKLGGNCEIGSTAEPVVQNLTSGNTTSPLTGETLHGTAGSLEILLEGAYVALRGAVLIDNTYAVPAAHGCGGPANEAFLDPVVDKAFGIPAQAGASVTELDGTFQATVASEAARHGV